MRCCRWRSLSRPKRSACRRRAWTRSACWRSAVLAGAFIALGAMFATTVLAGADGVVPFGTEPAAVGPGVLPRAHSRGGRRRRAVHRQYADGDGLGGAARCVCAKCCAPGRSSMSAISSARSAPPGWCSCPDNTSPARAAWRRSRSRSALNKVTLSFDQALFLGILCNVLVCLAVWLAFGARQHHRQGAGGAVPGLGLRGRPASSTRSPTCI